MHRRVFVGGVAVLVTGPMPIHAQQRVTKIVVPYSPGGGSDSVARILGEGLSRELNRTFIVENKPGAGATLGTQYAANSKRDGTTLLLAHPTSLIVAPLLKKLKYDPRRDLVPIGRIATGLTMMVVRKDFPGDTFQQVIDEIRRNPGKYTYATPGVGTMTHLMGELMNVKFQLRTEQVAYKGSAEFVSDILGGRVDISYDTVVNPQAMAGDLKPVVCMASIRHPEFPNLPTLRELGYDVEIPNWFALLAPAGTPQSELDQLTAASRKVVETLDKDKLLKSSMLPSYLGPSELMTRMSEEEAVLRDVVARAAIKIE